MSWYRVDRSSTQHPGVETSIDVGIFLFERICLVLILLSDRLEELWRQGRISNRFIESRVYSFGRAERAVQVDERFVLDFEFLAW